MVTKEKDEELALFLELRRREKEKERSNLVVGCLVASDAPLGIKGGMSSLPQPVPQPPTVPQRRTAAEKFLDSENDKSDYDWLITPPGTPLVPSMERELQKDATNARPTALKSRLTNIQEVPPSRTNGPSKPMAAAGSNRRSSSIGAPKSTSRPSTPTSRPTLPSSRPRSSTPTPRPTLSSSTKPAAASGARSSTPSRTTSRSSTPTASRPSLPSSKSTSRSSTPTGPRSSTPSSSRSSSVTRSAAHVVPPSKNPAPASSRGSSPTVKPRTWKPNEMPGFSHDAPPNLRTSLPERPASATRGRPGGARSSATTAAAANGRPRQQSCSPARVRTSTNGNGPIGSKLPVSIKSSRSSQLYDGGEDLNPGLMGTQMVERVVNMRKLGPPKQDDYRSSSHSNSAGNMGRSLSKKSLDMALRHMDIRRSINGNLRPLMTNIPASSMYSVRSSGGSTRSRSRTVSASESPHATSSSASSSEPSVSNAFFVDGMEGEENEFTSEKGNSSPISQVSSCR